ncbi:MAG: nuclear transport factor 2 family protein [Rhodospirillales bacterium]|nr:nuclear transport factor 2 family protein [Rhodospirillales bacterium]
MKDIQTLLFANDAFYAAFAQRDLPAMTALWSSREPVACLHPGWPPLVGRETVLRSWASILEVSNTDIAHEDPEAWREGGVGIVICNERLGGSLLTATNLFRLEGERWLLFHHQAGAVAAVPPPPPPRPSTLQ